MHAPRARTTAARVVGALVVLALLAGCEQVAVDHVDERRADAGRPALPVADSLVTSARAHSAEMCAARRAAPSADAAEAHDRETWAAVDELVGRARLDPSTTNATSRNVDATNVIWGRWAGNPTLVAARWDAIGVGEVTCDDGFLYQTLVLGDSPTMPTSGRYSTIQSPQSSLTEHVGLEYGTAVDWQGKTVSLLLDVYVPPGATTSPRPTVVFAHGGGFSKGSRSGAAAGARDMARRGFVVASIDYRLDPRLDNHSEGPIFLQGASNAIDDAMESVRWLKAHAATYGIDGDRMAFMGSSAGGAIALGVGEADDPTPGGPLASVSPRVQAAVSTGAQLTPGIDAGLVTFEETDAPALMFHYEHDTARGTDVAYAQRTCDAIRDGGSTCDFVTQAGSGHTVGIFSSGPFWTSDVGPFLWDHLDLAG